MGQWTEVVKALYYGPIFAMFDFAHIRVHIEKLVYFWLFLSATVRQHLVAASAEVIVNLCFQKIDFRKCLMNENKCL